VDGIWQATITVPLAAGLGVWTVYELVARDTAGNTTDVFAPAPPSLDGSFVVTRMAPVLGQSVSLPRGESPPPAVASLTAPITHTYAKVRTSIRDEIKTVSSAPNGSPSVPLPDRAGLDPFVAAALAAISRLLADLRQYLG
jgi:hypothetical protein